MTFTEFTSIIDAHPEGVILLEGRRAIPAGEARRATSIARSLAGRFQSLRFRSGNAPGSDQAFSEGVAQVDSKRLQVLVPYASHRTNARFSGATYDSPDVLSREQVGEVASKTVKASPQNRGLIEKRDKNQALAAKASYLLRDTMKVTGYSDHCPKPVCALFFVDLQDPLAGGTGHTIRVCQLEGVPVAFQDSWLLWFKG